MKKEYLIKSYLIISYLITTNLNSLVLILSISFNVTFSASILVSLIRWRFSLKPAHYYPNMSDSDEVGRFLGESFPIVFCVPVNEKS